MINENPNDEYQFIDTDNAPMESMETIEQASTTTSSKRAELPKDVKRNALIALGLIILIVVIYKLVGSLLSSKPHSEAINAPMAVTTIRSVPVSKPVQFVPATPPATPNVDSSQVGQKLAIMEIAQRGVRSEISTINTQLTTVTNSVNDLTTKIASLNQTITTLAAKIDQQSNEIALLMARTAKPKPVIHTRKLVAQSIYYLQAVIPGRAWLISTNGSTLTVREGTTVPGYGLVKLIDPTQGRVLTSSGRIIRFSQQDS